MLKHLHERVRALWWNIGLWRLPKPVFQPGTALVIVHMQPYFLQYNDKDKIVLSGVCREVDAAVEAGMPIVVLEWSYGEDRRLGSTSSEIMTRLKHYKLARRVNQRGADGSPTIAAALTKLRRMTAVIRVMGVSADACVTATATGLRMLFPKAIIEIVADGCNKSGSDWSMFRSGKAGVRVVTHKGRVLAPCETVDG